MNVCASKEASRLDTELNSLYDKIIARAGSRRDYASKVQNVRKAWAAYRDAYITAMYPAHNREAQYGSVYPMEANLVRAKLTQEQLIDASRLLQQYTESDEKAIRR